MLILIEDTERGMDVAKGIWGAFSSCLYVEDERISEWSLEYIINSCERDGVTLIVVANNVEEFREKNKHAVCIYCDGGNIGNEDDRTLVFMKEDKRDSIVTLIINFLKRKKLL